MKIKRLRRQETPWIVGDNSARSEPTEVADSNDFKPLLKEKRLKEQTERCCEKKTYKWKQRKERRSTGEELWESMFESKKTRNKHTREPENKDLLLVSVETKNYNCSREIKEREELLHAAGKKRLKDTKDCWFNNKWNKVAHLLGSAQGDQEAVKECYKEYIGMVKIYYEGAQRSKQGRPGEDVVGNSSGTAWIKEPQAFAKMSVEIEDTLDGTPRKKSRIARDDVNKESNEKQKQLEERLKDTKDCWFNKWNKVAHLLGSGQGDQEAVKECYKEYIGMVKIYYEGTQRSKQGRPGEDVVGNSSGTAWIKEPQDFAKMSVEIEDTLDGTPRKKSRIARDDVNKESNEKQKQLEGLFRCRLPTISDAWRLEA
ncbi:hypothetical protein Tco_0303882 [Tanacetum coccineum]